MGEDIQADAARAGVRESKPRPALAGLKFMKTPSPRNRTQEHAREQQRRSVGSAPEGQCPDPRERERALHAPQPHKPAPRRR